jgi:hypothetical protein
VKTTENILKKFSKKSSSNFRDRNIIELSDPSIEKVVMQ